MTRRHEVVKEMTDEDTKSYYGSTLKELCGHDRPDKTFLKSLECTRLASGKCRSTIWPLNIIPRAVGRPETAKRRLLSSRDDCNTISPHDKTRLHLTVTQNGNMLYEQRKLRETTGSRCTSAVTRESVCSDFSNSSLVRRGRCRPKTMSESCGTSQKTSLSGRACTSAVSRSSTRASSLQTSHLVKDLNLNTTLCIWCIENKKLANVAETEQGFFHQGNVYILFKRNSESCRTYLHIWQGSLSSQNDQMLARNVVSEIDRVLNRVSFISFESECSETVMFRSLFKNGIVTVEGKSIATKVTSGCYNNRLYYVKGGQFLSATCMECSALAITDDNAIILDGYPRVYVCIGKNVDFILREKTLQLAKLINDQHGAERSQIIVMDENDEHLKKRFATKLDPNLPCYRQSSEEIFDEVIPQETLQLFKINGSRAEYDMPLVSSYPLHQKYLTSQGIFLLKVKTTQPVYIWVGQCADSFAISEALLNGQMFMQTHHFPASTPLCRVRENEEPTDFKKYFKDWKDKIHPTPSKAVHTYTVANIERALLSNCETQIIGKLKEIQKEVNVLECSKDYEVWLIDEHLIPLKTTSYPAFDRSHCYLILCHRTNGENKNCVLYYWMGERASSEKKKLALSVTLQCQSFLSNNCLMIRVLEGKEPKHFLTVLNSCLIVYDGGPNQDISTSDMNLNFENNVIIFCVRECHEDLVTVSQVQSSSKCLNSSATFVVMSRSQKYLWYGKNSTVLERDYAKHMMNHFCPERLHDYIIVGEDREPDQFWTCVLKHGEHLDQFPPKSLCCGEPRLIMCNQSQEKWLFNDIYDFCHENLYESAIYILDTRDCILLWIGQSINEVTQDMISSIFSAYLSIDLTNRQESDIEIWILHQSNEPFLFSNMFGDICFKHAKIMYQQERKRLRIENALINLSRQEENADSSIDMQHLKLPDSEFHAVFRMRKSVFHHLPRWKQHQILKFKKMFSFSNLLVG
uniref:HP domain-containing protein n=2 Tax=Biomphalaria glabrata TaxID=6526 RepID=A0A2C9KFR9_BIOGL